MIIHKLRPFTNDIWISMQSKIYYRYFTDFNTFDHDSEFEVTY